MAARVFLCTCLRPFDTKQELRAHIGGHRCGQIYTDRKNIQRKCVQDKGHMGAHWGWPVPVPRKKEQ